MEWGRGPKSAKSAALRSTRSKIGWSGRTACHQKDLEGTPKKAGSSGSTKWPMNQVRVLNLRKENLRKDKQMNLRRLNFRSLRKDSLRKGFRQAACAISESMCDLEACLSCMAARFHFHVRFCEFDTNKRTLLCTSRMSQALQQNVLISRSIV